MAQKDDFTPDDFTPDDKPEMTFAIVNGVKVPLGSDTSDIPEIKSKGSDQTDDFTPDDFTPDETLKEPSLASKAYDLMMKPLLDEFDASQPNLLGGGVDVGSGVPGLNKIYPGGVHIPGAAQIFNELIRPMSSPFGLGTMGLEGMINRFGGNVNKSAPDISEPIPNTKLLGPASTNLDSTVGIPTGEIKPKQIELGPIRLRTKPVRVDEFLRPIEPEHHAANLVENEGKGINPIGIKTDEAVRNSLEYEKNLIGEDIEDEMSSRVPRLDRIREYKDELKSLPDLYKRSKDVFLDSSTGINDKDYLYAHPDSPNANPLALKDPDLALSNQGYFGSGKPEEILHPNRLEPASEIIPEEVKTASRIAPEERVSTARNLLSDFLKGTEGSLDVDRMNELIKNLYQHVGNVEWLGKARVLASAGRTDEALDVIKANLQTPEESILPRPGRATVTSKNVGPLEAAITSPDQTLRNRPITKPIADLLISAQDRKQNWIATTERELSDLSDGLNKEARVTLGKLIDGQVIQGAPLELQQRAQKARVVLDNIHEMFPEGATKAGENVGYLENYFTHLQHQPSDISSAISEILDHHFGVFKRGDDVISGAKEGIGDIAEKGHGNPSSPFVEERTGKQQDLEYDVNKVFPAYVESAAKVIFDKEAVAKAVKQLDKIPDSNLKDLASAYIKNYANYGSERNLTNAWSKWTGAVARTTARSLLGFNTGLQTLHLARVFGNLYPELGEKYTGYGLAHLARNPIQAWHEAASLGLLQNEIRPFNFRTPLEKMDSISNFLSTADYIDKAAGYYGFKKKFMDQGLPESQAKAMALDQTKRVSQTVDPARGMMAFRTKSPNPLAQAAVNLGGMFKQVPAKIVEQYVRIAANSRTNPKATARMAAGVGAMLAANEGLRTVHLDPLHMIPTSIWGPFGDVVNNVVKDLKKGDVESALKETVLWAVPGGKSIQRQIAKGPSALQ